jgi:hypothetical protein
MRSVQTREKSYQAAYAKASFEVLTSGADEPVPDSGAKGHSPFNYYLVQALEKNKNTVFDVYDIFPGIRAGISNFNTKVRPLHQSIKDTVGEGGAFIFFRKPQGI